jgi:hypothetical protein
VVKDVIFVRQSLREEWAKIFHPRLLGGPSYRNQLNGKKVTASAALTRYFKDI